MNLKKIVIENSTHHLRILLFGRCFKDEEWLATSSFGKLKPKKVGAYRMMGVNTSVEELNYTANSGKDLYRKEK